MLSPEAPSRGICSHHTRHPGFPIVDEFGVLAMIYRHASQGPNAPEQDSLCSGHHSRTGFRVLVNVVVRLQKRRCWLGLAGRTALARKGVR
jgi:hypothetical protein